MNNNNCIPDVWDADRENYSWKYFYVNPKSWGRKFKKFRNDNEKIINAQTNYKDLINDVQCINPEYPIKDNDYITGVYNVLGKQLGANVKSNKIKNFDRVEIKCRKSYDDISEKEQINCCSGLKDNRDCSPEFCKNNDSCNQILNDYCSKDNNIIESESCVNIKDYNEELYNNLLKSYCTYTGNE